MRIVKTDKGWGVAEDGVFKKFFDTREEAEVFIHPPSKVTRKVVKPKTTREVPDIPDEVPDSITIEPAYEGKKK